MTGKAPIGKIEKILGIPGVELAYAANAFSIIGGIATVAGFFAQRSENRKIIGKLNEIQDYLKVLDEKINHIIQQNKTILEKLDQLPVMVEAIVEDIVSNHLLDERYNALDAIRKNYFLLNAEERERYRINTVGWDRISEALNYIVSHENKLSKIVEIISWCEFALVATEGRSIKVVRTMTFGKGSMIIPLFSQLRDNLRTSHNNLLTLLSSQYVTSHNLSDNLQNLDDLTYELANDKKDGFFKWVLQCPPGQIPNGGCQENQVWVSMKANVTFNKRKQKIPTEIENQKRLVHEHLEAYLSARDSLLMLLSYFDLLSDDAVELSISHLDTKVDATIEISQNEIQFIPMG